MSPSGSSMAGEGAAPPLVSILMVARNAGPFIDAAILTARRQTLDAIEIVVVDDGSTDDTRAVAKRHAAEDARVRVLAGPCTGLADVRNASLAAARGRWAAILDSDDMLHPEHLERLVASAERTNASVTAANMLSFAVDDDGVRHVTLFADAPGWREECAIDLARYVRANSAAGDAVSAGYLKPLFDLAFLREHTLRYDPRLRIAEDYDLVARILAAGGSFHYLPAPTYFYRRHALSTSSRLTVRDLEGMIAAGDSALAGPAADVAVRTAVARRTAGLRAALAHARAIDGLKARRPLGAVRALAGSWGAVRLMGRTIVEATQKRLPRRRRASGPHPTTLLIGEGALAEPHLHRAAPGDAAAIGDGLPPITDIVLGAGVPEAAAAFVLSPRARVRRLSTSR